MNARAEAPVLQPFLTRATRRLALRAGAYGAAAGTVAAAVLIVGSSFWRWPQAVAVLLTVLLAAAGVLVSLIMTRRQRQRVAELIDRRTHSRNLLVTAAEIMRQPGRVSARTGALVVRQAEQRAAQLDARALFPLRRALLWLAGSVLLLAAATMIPAPDSRSETASKASALSAVIGSIEIDVVPPAYTGLPAQTLRDPTRIDVLAGSRLRLRVRADAGSVMLETMSARRAFEPAGPGNFAAETRAEADDFLAIEPASADGRTGIRRLIGLTVREDQSPRLRVLEPGRDLFLTDARQDIRVAVDARDDFGLATLRLHYTKVSGSGERFTFSEGVIPLDISRTDGRAWTARGTLPLAEHGLEPGDMIVYRAEGTDARPGAVASQSDSYIIEITAPGALAAEGFSLDDEHERYGISQQMVILKTERLLAGAAQMPPDSLRRAALALAAEQRSVRAEFVFMMGGELAEEIEEAAGTLDVHEEAHAAADEELLAGRLANRGRVQVTLAIRSMSRAVAALNSAELQKALQEERTALTHLQEAFARTRYILRALTQRERLDLARRLTGVLDDARGDARPARETEPDAQLGELRRALAGLAGLTGQVGLAEQRASVAQLAEAILRIDASDTALHEIADQLNEAARALERAPAEQVRLRLGEVATRLTEVVRARLLEAPRPPAAVPLRRLHGALIDALRQPEQR